MARIRTVKPELFLDEELGILSGDHIVFFIGLLTLADCKGRLSWRPIRIKASIFPYREVDVRVLAKDLDTIDKIQLYEVENESYLCIPGFIKHQRPHPKEQESMIPEPPSREKKRQAVKRFSCIPSSPVGREGKGREGKGREGDLGFAAEHPPPPSKKDMTESHDCQVENLKTAWNMLTTEPIPKWLETPPHRKKAAIEALKRRSIEEWKQVFQEVESSNGCRGGWEGGWVADIDWAIRPAGRKPEPAVGLLEGKYKSYNSKSSSKVQISSPGKHPPIECEIEGCPITDGATWFGHTFCYKHGAEYSKKEETEKNDQEGPSQAITDDFFGPEG